MKCINTLQRFAFKENYEFLKSTIDKSISDPSNVITFEKKLQTYVVHLMCSLLPSLLTAERRLRLSSQYLRCQIAKKASLLLPN